MASFRNNKRKSFFAEQRDSNTNPNFMNNIDNAFIRSNVKRILRDVSDDIILPDDYIYFKNNNIINACIQESYENYQVNQTLRHALTAYRTIVLPGGMIPPDVDINLDYMLTATELSKVSDRENVWAVAYKIFSDIQQNGVDPRTALVYICRFPKHIIKSL